MPDISTQTFIVQFPSSLARRIAEIMDYEDAPYASISEFLKVAAENQLVLDQSLSIDIDSVINESGKLSSLPTSARARSQQVRKIQHAAPSLQESDTESTSSRSDGSAHGEAVSTSALLEIPTSISSVKLTSIPAGEPLTALTNRLSPLLAGPRVLANLTKANGAPPRIDSFTEAGARAARELGLMLRDEDDAAGRRGRMRRSTAWPVGDDEAKSLIRYRNSFMLSSDGKGAIGPLVDFRFVFVEGAEVYLTEIGAAIAGEVIPAIDLQGEVDLMTPALRRLFSESIVQIPGEVEEIRMFLQAVAEVQGAQDQVDLQISASHPNWSEAQVVSHRAAMIGRLRDLAVIDVETQPRTRIIEGAEHKSFIQLLDSSQNAKTAGGN
jgi:hypothetical protein